MTKAKTTGPALPLAIAINGDASIQKEITPQAMANPDRGSSLGLNAWLRFRNPRKPR